MNEQILAQAKPKYNMNVLTIITFAFFAILDFFIIFIHSLVKYGSYTAYYYSSVWETYVPVERTWSPGNIVDSFEDLLPFAIGLPILGLILAIIVYLSKSELTVTNMRVYGRGFLGKRVDLPVDSISAIATTLPILRGIIVSTSSGKISFVLINNHEHIHKALSQVLIDRQIVRSNPNQSHAQTDSIGYADELKKYKELLDAGVITQEEFDAKKKQLLGL